MKNTIDIKITPEDIKGLNFTNTGRVIDELSYSAGEWTEDDLFMNNLEYEADNIEPYNFNFEDDLLQNTKTMPAFKKLLATLKIDIEENTTKVNDQSNLQAGAYYAINYPEAFNNLLKEYTAKVKEQLYNYDIILSAQYQKEIEENRESYQREEYNEWLYGDHRNYRGVIALISKYYTEDSEAGSYNEKEDIFTFTIDKETAKEELEAYQDGNFTIAKYKIYLLEQIKNKINNRYEKDQAEKRKRKEEREKTEAYKKQRKAEEEAERLAKLKTLIK